MIMANYNKARRATNNVNKRSYLFRMNQNRGPFSEAFQLRLILRTVVECRRSPLYPLYYRSFPMISVVSKQNLGFILVDKRTRWFKQSSLKKAIVNIR